MPIDRRSFLTGAATGSLSLVARAARARSAQPGRADFAFIQYHNQTAGSSLHQRLVEMWAAIRTETRGRIDTRVFAQNNDIPGSDPAALKMLVAGEIQFFTLMGGILGTVVPVAEVQQVPFVFRSAAHAHETMDGPLGAFVRGEMAAAGLHGFPVGAFDNGMRQVAGVKRPVRVPADLVGIRMRVPAGQMVADVFGALGAEPVTINSSGIYDALKTGRVDAQENPLALVDGFKLYEVVTYVSMTNHMWSGFNQLAHLATWQRLPGDLRAIIERHVTRHVRLQREDQDRANARLRRELSARDLRFNDVDAAPFRRQLAAVYTKWKGTLGTTCWSLLEAATGSIV